MPQIPITMVPQSPHMNWCWAAITASLLVARGRPPMAMCQVVTETAGPPCCSTPTSALCNVQSDLIGPLHTFGLLREPRPGQPPLGVLPFKAPAGTPSVTSEIAASRPVAVGFRIGQLRHFGVIVGVDLNSFVFACDPFFILQPQRMPYDTLVSGYQPNARWVRSYLIA